MKNHLQKSDFKEVHSCNRSTMNSQYILKVVLKVWLIINIEVLHIIENKK